MKKRHIIKRLNWFSFVAVIILAILSALANKNTTNVKDGLILGAIGGVVFGLPILILGRASL